MNVQKSSVNASPYVGIFCRTTETFTLAPPTIFSSEKKNLENALNTKIIFTSLAQSPLLGVLCIANQNGVVLPQIIEKNEIVELEKHGLSVLQVDVTDAVGNLLAVNDNVGFCSPLVGKKTKDQIAQFLKIKIITQKIADSDLVGSNLVLSNAGFVCNPTITPAEFRQIQKHSGLTGNKTSANYGDLHPGNCVAANSHGAIVGPHSTPHEMFAIDEALSGSA